MTNIENKKRIADYEIDLKELVSIVWYGKWLISGFILFSAVIAVVIALWLPNIYKAEAILAPSEESQGGGLSQMAEQLGGLATLAGVDIGNKRDEKVTIALEILKSRSFLSNFVGKYDFLPQVMASKGWNLEDGIIYDEDDYDIQLEQWVRDVDPPLSKVPSDQEVVEKFREDLLFINRNDNSGIVEIGIFHHSPQFAKEVVDLLVKELNKTMRDRDVQEAQRSLEYLKDELEKTSLRPMEEVFYQLIEQQTQTMMLANIRPEYIFHTIDPAVVPEKKVRPSRVMIVFFGVFIGGVVGFFVAFYFKNKNTKEIGLEGNS